MPLEICKQCSCDAALFQGIIDSTGTETRQRFCSMFVMAKSFEELFTPTWNGIAASVWYVSSTPGVLGATLND